jgi:hypothetical protein
MSNGVVHSERDRIPFYQVNEEAKGKEGNQVCKKESRDRCNEMREE